MLICKKCGGVVYYNSYFKGHLCNSCGHFEIFTQRPTVRVSSLSINKPRKKVISNAQ